MKLLPPRALSAALLVLTLFAVASFYHRSCFIDDAWLGERAYWLAHEGVVRSELFRDLLGYEERMFVFHKVFALTGAAFIKLFGWSLYVLKSVSLLYLVMFLGLLFYYCRRFELSLPFALPALLLLAHGLIGRAIFVYRPEVMLMTLGFGSFVLLRHFLEQSRWGWLVASAFVAGLCVLTHLNGVRRCSTSFGTTRRSAVVTRISARGCSGCWRSIAASSTAMRRSRSRSSS